LQECPITKIKSNYEVGRITVTSSAEEGDNLTDVQFIAGGTPPGEDSATDLKCVPGVANTIATHVNNPKIIVDKSTVARWHSRQSRSTNKNTLKEKTQT